MKVKAFRAYRKDYPGYGSIDESKPFEITIELEGYGVELKLAIAPETSDRIMEIISEEVAAAGRKAADALIAQAFIVPSLPAPAPASDEIPY